MNKNNASFLLLMVFGLGILLGHVWQPSGAATDAPVDFSRDGKVRDLEAQLSDARKKIAALQQAARVTPALPAQTLSAKTPPAVDAAPPTADNEKMKALESQLLMQKVKVMNQWLQDGYATSRNFDPGAVMQHKFDEEPTDSTWAQAQENKLLNAFSSQAELAEFAVVDSKCKSSICQLSVSFTDLDQANKIAAQVAKTVAAADQSASVIASPNAERKVTTLYISHANEKSITN